MDYQEILQKIKSKLNQEDQKIIDRAFEFAEKAHKNQLRKSGESYIIHPLMTAQKITELNLDSSAIAAALLHDTVEDTNIQLEKIEKEFGNDIAFLVDGVTKLGKIKYRGAERQIESLRKFFLAMAKDIRVVLIKLADRLHNMQTLSALPENKRQRIALETLEIYAPLANRLGMGELKGLLEDLAFPYIYPKEYEWLIKNVKEEHHERKKHLEKLKPIVLYELQKENINPIEIQYRAKHYYSLYKKLLKSNMDINQIYDLASLRIIVDGIDKCYGALGVIHKLWKPMPGKIKDYIAMPKANGYRSLHTTVFGPNKKLTEFQIRTPQMHQEAELGIAAHWAYKENKNTDEKELSWINQLKDWHKEVSGSKEYLESLKIDFFKDRIFTLTPKGEVIDLPEGSTPIDFAYNIHSELGNSCSGAKVNNKIVPLDYQLRNNDMVEILSQKNKNPSQSWLGFIKTTYAKNKIKNALKNSGKIKFDEIPKKRDSKTSLRISVRDRVGLLKDISNLIAGQKINIINIGISNQESKFPVVEVILKTTNVEKIEKLIVKLKQIKNIIGIHYNVY